jgi:hypothetical protein
LLVFYYQLFAGAAAKKFRKVRKNAVSGKKVRRCYAITKKLAGELLQEMRLVGYLGHNCKL